MKLRNNFPDRVRLLYLNHWECFLCGSNGTASGGLEIHHIWGRISDSAFNSSCLCKGCHAHVGHSVAEHEEIFRQTWRHLERQEYKPTESDHDFLRLVVLPEFNK